MTAPFSILGIDHVVIRAADMERMLTFYQTVLGCTMEREVTHIGLYQLRAGRSLIDLVDARGELGKKGGPPPGSDALNMDHLCMRIDPWNPDRIYGHLTDHDVHAGPVATRNGAEGEGPSIYLSDPEGNIVELKGPPST